MAEMKGLMVEMKVDKWVVLRAEYSAEIMVEMKVVLTAVQRAEYSAEIMVET